MSCSISVKNLNRNSMAKIRILSEISKQTNRKFRPFTVLKQQLGKMCREGWILCERFSSFCVCNNRQTEIV